MNNSIYDVILRGIQKKELEVSVAGRKEYAQGDDVFSNFNALSRELGMDRKQILVVYAKKHWDGIMSYLRGHKSQRENVRGRIKDLRMYLAILWAMIEEEEAEAETGSEPIYGIKECPHEDIRELDDGRFVCNECGKTNPNHPQDK